MNLLPTETPIPINYYPYQKLILVGIMTLHAALLAYSATLHSPTLDEPAHLVAGLSHWEFGRFDLYRVNPPLTRVIAAIPVLFVGYEADWSGYFEGPGTRPVFNMGRDFISANGSHSLWLMTLARWACIPISLLGCWFSYCFAKELYGTLSGFLAAIFWCFSPNIMAHSELITPDCAATTFGIGATYYFWRWLKQPSWIGAIIAGGLLGLAELSKATWIILFGLWSILWLFWLLVNCLSKKNIVVISPDEKSSLYQQGYQLIAILMMGIYLLNLGYGFEGSLQEVGDYQFVSSMLTNKQTSNQSGNRFTGTMLAKVPVPFPSNYVYGIDIQKRDFENWPQTNYLRGEWKQGGWWYYYLYAFLVKTPVGILLLFLFSMISRLRGWDSLNRWRDEVILITPGLLVLLIASSQSGQNAHYRYVLPTLGFSFVLIARIGACLSISKCDMKELLFGIIILVAPLWLFVSSSLMNYPHQLCYFSVLAGGRQNGYLHLLGSNVDWGQDLLFVKKWQQAHPHHNVIWLNTTALFYPGDIGLQGKIQREVLSQREREKVSQLSGVFLMGVEKYLRLMKNPDYQNLLSMHGGQVEWVNCTHVILTFNKAYSDIPHSLSR